MTKGVKDLSAYFNDLAEKYGFSCWSVTSARLGDSVGAYLQEFIARGWHGDMSWLATTMSKRVQPSLMWPAARSAFILGCNYAPSYNPLDILDRRDIAHISAYARGRDYHDVLKGRLKQIASGLHSRTGWGVKIFVDTAPLMEKPLAAQSGLGWQGKHTNLVSREFGSWLFLGVILTDGDFPSHSPSISLGSRNSVDSGNSGHIDHCGSCRACLDICPTNAFPAPYQLEARRCISYLTIEYEGHIALEFRRPIGNRVFGCDDCLAICPWNKFASMSRDIKLKPQKDFPTLAHCLAFDESSFRAYFTTSPIKRTGYIRFMRNVLIASGNAGDICLVSLIKPYLIHADSRLRAMAIWALSQYLCSADLKILCPKNEPDAAVQAEWKAALGN